MPSPDTAPRRQQTGVRSRLRGRLQTLVAEIVDTEVAGLRKRVRRLEKAQRRDRRALGQSRRVVGRLDRLEPQLASLEERVHDLATALEDLRRPLDPGDVTAQDEARSLVDEIRREHARVRARLSAMTAFEERVRVLEEADARDTAPGRRP